MSELTDEQRAFLDKFMDWSGGLGLNAANREAVMDRAVEKGYYEFKYAFSNDGTDVQWYCRIRRLEGLENAGTGPTRFIALVNALIEAEKK